ncbi:adenosylcobinamide-GDP ribazoletransferase [Rhizobium sp. SG2393]|uniref:adenosylcobinamide-GDP ribazoletransferase n=1 Tax=Rhizobium sp. SG2393 TaxID=3276279 RepID=UPI003672F7B0
MRLRDFTDDLARSIAFLSRFPVPERHFVGFDGRLVRAARAFPAAGLMIALPAAALLSMMDAFRADPTLAALLAVAILAIGTGALHEDGLADVADGLGATHDREKALTIMKDSRIGTFGGLALILSVAIRVAAIAALVPAVSPTGLGLILLAVAALSRTAMVWHWQALPPARRDGIAASAGVPDADATRFAIVSGLGAGLVLLALAGAGLLPTLVSLGLSVGVLVLFGRFIESRLGGHTGDTIGAAQQMTEMALLTALALTV